LFIKENSKTGEDSDQQAGKDEETPEDRELDNYVQTMGVSGAPLDSLFETNEASFKISKSREELELELIEFRKQYLIDAGGSVIDSVKMESDETAESEERKRLEAEHLMNESMRLWLDYENLTRQLSKELCEQLRLILEPTVCSKLKGDYKTGKRLNMRRVIEYIATEYRKDKIWLRRTKPNKRDYQVLLAVDNSSSMSDNHCMELTYETICTITNAFNYLEVGQFGLVSFGNKVNLIHDLSEQFGTDLGPRVFSQVNFKDDRTKIAEVKITFIRKEQF
jgi:midasin